MEANVLKRLPAALVAPLMIVVAQGCLEGETTSKANKNETCEERAERLDDPNELYYCPENFEGPLPVPATGEGWQVKFGPYVQTETEIEICQTVQVPRDQDVLVRQFAARMRPGSHHFLMYSSDVDLPDDVYYPCFAGYPADGVTGVPEFVEAGLTEADIDFGTLTWLAGLQAPGALETPDYEALGNYAARISGGTQLILNSHSLNLTGKPITMEVWVNAMEVKDPEAIQEEIGFITWIGFPLSIEPFAVDETKTYYVELPQYDMDEWEDENGKPLNEMKIHLLTAHAHRRMLESEVVIERQDGTEELVYWTDSWFEPEFIHFNPPLLIERGDIVRYSCTYTNHEDRTVELGDEAEDEMCNIFGAYSPYLGGNFFNSFILE